MSASSPSSASATLRSARSSDWPAASAGTATLNGVRFLGLFAASGLVEGGVVALQLAFAFMNLPIALGARPVAVASLPQWSRFVTRGDTDRYQAEYRRSIPLGFLLVFPAAAGLGLLAVPIARGIAVGEDGPRNRGRR